MSLEVIFLGTSASIPTRDRSLPAVAVKREGEVLLFDCGEGVQRQMIIAKVGFNRKMKILLTHMHGDHILGLPGILQTMSLLGRGKPLQIYGPTGVKAFVESIIETVHFSLSFPLEIYEVTGGGRVCEGKGYELIAVFGDHTVPSLTYALAEKPRPGKFNPERALSLGVEKGPLWGMLQRGYEVTLPSGRVIRPNEVLGEPRPGRKIVYTGDTRPSDNVARLSRDADLLIHEATFADDLAERALEEKHSTFKEAAEIAKRANARFLMLTHISARYRKPETLLHEAKSIFPEATIARDFMRVQIPISRNHLEIEG